MITLTVTANGQVIGEYDAGTKTELAFQVAEACARKRQSVTVFDGTDYIGHDGSKHADPVTWPMPRPVGRPKLDKPHDTPPPAPGVKGRPKLTGQIIKVRLSNDDIANAMVIGDGNIEQGIRNSIAYVYAISE